MNRDSHTHRLRRQARRPMTRGHWLPWLVLLLALPACRANPPDNRWSTVLPEEVFFLEFDNDGELVDPAEFFRARRSLETGRVERLLVLSLGWSYDRAKALQGYRDLMLQYMTWLQGELGVPLVELKPDGTTHLALPPGWGVACVVWNSRSTGVTTFLRDLIPGSTFADVVGYVPDRVLFPFTFWAKAAKANKISYSLVRHLDALFGSLPVQPPDLYLVGHSFGCRVINSVVATAREDDQHLHFAHGERVRGALYIQPAMTYQEVPRETSMPVVVTQSMHDHANSMLFPIANIIGNTFGMTLWLKWSDGYKRQDVDRRVEALFVGAEEPAPGEEPPSGEGTLVGRGAAWSFDLGKRVAAEAGGMLLGIVTSIPLAALSWGRGQLHELGARHINYPMDTLAQIPVVEGLVVSFDRHVMGAFGARQDWGVRHKGLFDFGPLVESVGRMDYPGVLPLQRLGDAKQSVGSDTVAFEFERTRQPGVHLLRADTVIRQGWSDYESVVPDAAWGLFDVVGAHNDFRKPEIYRLVHAVMSL